MITYEFLKDILSGKKKLLKQFDIKEVSFIPRFCELDVRVIWAEVKQIERMKQYFPSGFIEKKRIPPRPYLFTVF